MVESALVLRTRLVPIFLRRAARLRLRVSDLLKEHGLDHDATERSDVVIGLAAFRALTHALAKRANDELFGFHAALETQRGDFGELEYVCRNAPTVRSALERLAKFDNAINEQVRVKFDPRQRRLMESIPRAPDCLGREGNDFAVAHKVRIARELLGEAMQPTRAFFAHAKPKRVPRELSTFYGGADLVYGAGFNGFEISSEMLGARIDRADPALLTILEDRLGTSSKKAEPDPLSLLRRAITDHLADANISAEVLAKRLGTSERTLHRRLSDAGVSLRKLVDDVRRDVALAHLADHERPLKEIALRLGYSDVRAFTRAFQRWTGKTPAAFRK